MFGLDVSIDQVVFVPAAMICVFGALGVVGLRNPVHNALSLVATLFGVAVLFVVQEAYFLAAIQVIVYAGAVVVLFLFVIMLLGIDREEESDLDADPMRVYVGGGLAVAFIGLVMAVVLRGGELSGRLSETAPLEPNNDVRVLGRSLFVDNVFAFEITSVLLIIAVIGAVVLSRRPSGELIDDDELDAWLDAQGSDADAAAGDTAADEVGGAESDDAAADDVPAESGSDSEVEEVES